MRGTTGRLRFGLRMGGRGWFLIDDVKMGEGKKQESRRFGGGGERR